MHPELSTQHLPRCHRQGLGQPQALPLQRHGGRRHIIHAHQSTQCRTQQHRQGSGSAGKHGLQHRKEAAALPHQRRRANDQAQDAHAAVEHIVGAGGEPAQLPAQQGPVDALRASGLFAVLHLGYGPGGGGQLQKAPGDKIPHQGKQTQHHRRHNGYGRAIAHGHPAHQVQRVGHTADARAVVGGVGQQLCQKALGFGIEEVVRPDEHQGHQHCDKALVLQLLTDFSDDPSQGAGQGQHENGQKEQLDHAAYYHRNRDAYHHPVHDDGREQHNGGIHQTHEIHAHQPGRHNGAHGNRQRQQQVIILGHVEGGIGIENAAEYA